MKKTLFISRKLLLAGLLLPLGFAQAQTQPKPLLEASEPVPKWELGIDLKPLIGRSSADGVGYILKKYTKHNTAFRFKVNPRFQRYDAFIGSPYYNSIYGFYAGYEWIKKRKNNWLFYGFDISHRGRINPVNYFTNDDSVWGVEGILGMRQRLMPHLSLSVESHLSIDYHYLRISGLKAGYSSITPVPLYGVYLNYHL